MQNITIDDDNSSLSSFKSNKSIKLKTSILFPHHNIRNICKYIIIIIPISLIYIFVEIIKYYYDNQNSDIFYFWMFEIFFIHYFNSKKNKIKLYNHQKLAFLIIIIFNFGMKFISSFLKQCDWKNLDPNEYMEISKNVVIEFNKIGKKYCQNIYYYFYDEGKIFILIFIIVLIGYIISLVFHSYNAIKIRELINTKYISPYSFILFIGFFGIIICIICLIISSNFPCGKSIDEINYNIYQVCQFALYYKNKNNISKTEYEYYLDNFNWYFKSYKETDDIKKILEIIFSCFLPILSFAKTFFNFMIIKELGVFHLLLPEIIYQFLKDIYIFIFKIVKDIIDKYHIIQFILLIFGNLITLIGFCIYLELIELKFCGFDKDTKNNITNRSLSELLEDSKNLEIYDDEIEVNDDYTINFKEEKKIEMQKLSNKK